MGLRFRRRNFGLTSRSPTQPGRQDAPTRAPFLHSEEVSARLPAALLSAHGRLFFWVGMLATIAAGVVYLTR